VPVELGAEFIHGKPPQIFEILKRQREKPKEITGDDWYSQNGKLVPAQLFDKADELLGRMDDNHPDESFASFLSRQDADENAKNAATRYVEGFNAARANEISVHSLVHNSRAEEKIEGDRMFRLAGGYNSLLAMMCRDIDPQFTSLHTGTVVKRVRWSGDGVLVDSDGDGGPREWHARAAVITLPLGVLQAGDVDFDPPINAKNDALTLLQMGEVIRITLTFDHPLWLDASGPKTRDMRFLFAEDEQFPTWWTHLPEHVAAITGWAASHQAVDLSGRSEGVITAIAATSLASILGITDDQVMKSLSASYTHDWQSDPFSRGAYSWPKVGGADAHRELSWPLDNRLFFAGEATDFTGHNGTVHGAISSGFRCAKELLGYIRTRA
jgi:monoamine oxidase